MSNLTPVILETRINYFLRAYVKKDLQVGAKNELLNICNMFTVISMQMRAADLMDQITNHLLTIN